MKRCHVTMFVLLLAAGACSYSPSGPSTAGDEEQTKGGDDVANDSEAGEAHGAAHNRDRVAVRATAPSGDGASWPCWRGPYANGTSDETGLVRAFPEAGPNILWRTPLGTGFSGLSVAGGRVFTLFGAEGRECIAAFAADTGQELWRVDADADDRRQPLGGRRRNRG